MRRLIPVWILLNCLAITFFLNDNVHAQWRSKTHDKYEAVTDVKIKIEGNLNDWAGVPVWSNNSGIY